MKFAVQAFVLGICALGASAAVLTHSNKVAMVPSHQMVNASLPMPGCGPSGCTK